MKLNCSQLSIAKQSCSPVRFFFIQVEIKHELRLNNYYCYYWSCFCWQFIGLTLSTAYAICIADTFFEWYKRKNVDIDHFGFFFCFVLFCFFHSKRIRTVEHSIECFNWTGTRKLNLRVSRSITRQEYQIPRHLHRTQFQTSRNILISAVNKRSISSFIDIFSVRVLKPVGNGLFKLIDQYFPFSMRFYMCDALTNMTTN